MRSRIVLFTACLLVASHAFAQTPPPRPPKPPAAPAAPPAAPAPPAAAVPAPPPPPPAPAAPPAPPVNRQPINIRVDLTISEDGVPGAPIKKTITAVVGDGFNGYVREQALFQNTPGNGPFDRDVAPLNLDVMPSILTNGKIRLSCTIQYNSIQRPTQERRITTDIKQSLVLILESGKPLVISQATDPITDRHVTVEVSATILK